MTAPEPPVDPRPAPRPEPRPGAASPDLPDALRERLRQALALHRGGRLRQARPLYESILASHPAHFPTLNLLGSLLRSAGDPAGALAMVDRAIAVDARAAGSHNNRGNALHDLKRHEEALASFERALRIDPELPEAHNGRGNALRALRRLDEAMASYEQARRLRPDYPEAECNRGNVLLDLRRHAEAIACYDRAIAGRPDLAEAHHNRAGALKALGRFEESARAYARTLQVRPDYEFARGLWLHTKMLACDWTDLAGALGETAVRIARDEKVSPLLPVLSLFDSPQLHRQAARRWTRSQHPGSDVLGPLRPREASDRIRIGYFSADFRNHPVSYLAAGVFEAHDRRRFEVHGFSFGPGEQDRMRRRVAAGFDRFVDVTRDSDLAIARLAREMGLDIAIDLGGYTQDARVGIFSYRAAPVQVGFLGYPGTLGAPFMDYIVADEVVIPPESRDLYDEKVAWLPWFQPNDAAREVSERPCSRADFGLPEDAFVYCCFNTHYKITPQAFEGWMRILRAVPGSVLWLREHTPAGTANLRREAERRGVSPRRLHFAPLLPEMADHLARQRLADLFLDTTPYNAHTTASDALWVGLPVLTCAGRSYAGRVGASLLAAVGLPELVTHTPAEYEATAIALAADRPRLAALRERLVQARTTAPLFDTVRFTRNLESALEAMHARRRAGLPPDHLRAEAR
jgi:predicted O-linked N-acetylglucosamine transferase (SPINDLY family)